jgi:hypothetical protein
MFEVSGSGERKKRKEVVRRREKEEKEEGPLEGGRER